MRTQLASWERSVGTRLLVLGVVRIFQPVHGYVVRRELLTWDVDEWANVNPGSIYGALRTLTKGGHLVEDDTTSEGRRPARTTYRMTNDGEAEFFGLFRQNLSAASRWWAWSARRWRRCRTRSR